MITYKKLLHEVEFFSRIGVDVGAIGASEDGRILPYIFIGNKKAPSIFITGGIHAREHIASFLVMRQAEYTLNYFNSLPKERQKKWGGIYFIPTLNPDGLEICHRGVKALKKCDKKLVARLIKKENSYKGLYKANARGVDLNTNFDAKWGTGKANVFKPATANYVGKSAFSESETRAIRDFTLAIKPASTVSYHCLGREIYWEFGQNKVASIRDFSIVKFLNKKLNYVILPDDGTSAGGYKDWCITELGIPSFTIELGSDALKHPVIDYSLLKEDIKCNLDLPIRLMKYLMN
ncbi:MAG: hypothetical protein FWE13_00140 [Firmicutes bacterium]|nr:hypothetical protein [Bacillota bacterium]